MGTHDNAIEGYSRGSRPLRGHALLVGTFSSTFVLFLLISRSLGRSIPQRVRAADLLLLGVATHRLSRLLSKDAATSFLRAPFVEYVGPSQLPGEVVEKPRGEGLRLALGELLTNPLSTGQWVGAGLVYGLVLVPRLTRLVASIFTVVAVADFLQGRLAPGTRGRSSIAGLPRQGRVASSDTPGTSIKAR